VDVERTIEFILDQQAKSEVRMAKLEISQAKTEAALRRAFRLSVQEARAERLRRKKATAELNELITKIAAAQLVTEEKWQVTSAKLDALIESMRRGGNGHS
jgi:hypothetical protein